MTSLIMVVDDDCNLLRLIDMALNPLQGAVVTLDEPRAAINLLKSVTPDLFILDYMMPRMSGIELCWHIRAQRHTATVPIIMLSTIHDAATIRRGLDAGVNVFLPKSALHTNLVHHARALLDIENAVC